MKKFMTIMSLALLATGFVSCSKEINADEPVPEKREINFRFIADASLTKVGLETNDDANFTAKWDSGDNINIVCTNNKGDKVTDEEILARWVASADSSTPGYFETKLDAKDLPSEDAPYSFVGYWPARKSATELFPDSRKQHGDKFNGDYDIMISDKTAVDFGITESNAVTVVLPMKRQTSIAYFHIKSTLDEPIVRATLTTGEGEFIAAKEANLNADGFSPVDGCGKNSITLLIDGEMSSKDFRLWFNVLPVDYTSMKLVVETDKHSFTMSKKAAGSWKKGELNSVVINNLPADKWAVKETPSEPVEKTLEIKAYAESNSWTDGNQYNTITVDENLTVTCSGDSNTGKYYDSDNTWRVYQNESPKVTFTLSDGYKFQDAIITYKSGKNGVLVFGETEVDSGTSLSVSDKTSFDFGVGNTGTATNGNIQITSIYVKYVKSGSGAFDPANPNYAISVVGEILGGTVTPSRSYAKEGETFTVACEPDEGYEYVSESLVVKNAVTEDILLPNTNGEYTMPAANVVVEASFYKLPYRVTYVANAPQNLGEGQAAPVDSKDYTDEDNEVTIKDATLTCLDYNLVGWTIGQDGETVYKVGDTFEISANTTLYGKWEEKTYVVTLIAPEEGTGTYEVKVDGVAISSGDQFVNGTVLTYVEHPAPGYRFYNWQAVDESTHTYSSATSRTYTIDRHDVTIKGKFEVHPQHDVRFFVNGSQYGETLVVNEDELISFPDDPEDIYGFKFQGWYTTAGPYESAPDYVDPAKAVMGEENIDYYAVFAIEVSAEFDPNDISKTPAVSGETNTWKDIKTNITLKLSAGQLYTKGSPKTFTVTKSSSASNQNYFQVSHASLNITKIITTISSSEYKIVNVSSGAELTTSSDGLTQTVTASSLKSINCNATTSYQIRATKITVYSQSGFCSTVQPRTETSLSWSDDTVTAYLNSTTNTFPTLTSSPVGLAGIVYTSSNASVATINATTGDITIKGTGETTITASFGGDATYAPAEDASYTLTVSEYTTTVTLERNGATDGTANVTARLGFAMPLITKPSKTGHTFGGYYIDSECKGTQYYSTTGSSAKNWDLQQPTATLYAKWTVDEYNVTLNVNGGTINSGNVTKYTYGVGATLPTNVTKTGYTFGGWYTSSTFSGSAVTTISTTDTGAKTFYAKWDAKTYTVTLNKNDYGVADGSFTATYNQSAIEMVSDVAAAEGYTLKGYYTAATDGTLVLSATNVLAKSVSGYTDANGKWIKDGTATLYAQFSEQGSGTTSGTITIDQSVVTDLTTSYKDYTWSATDEGNNTITGHLFAYKNGGIQFNSDKAGSYCYNSDATPGNISSIVMKKASGKDRSWTLYVSNSPLRKDNYSSASKLDTKTVSTTDVTWTVTGSNKYFYLVESGGATVISYIKVSYN